MKHLQLLGLFLVILFAFSACKSKNKKERVEPGFSIKVGDLMPDFSAELTDGSRFSLSENKGKLILLQFTASWCAVCRKEMPHIEKEIWQKYKKDSVLVIGVDYKEPLKKAQKFINDTQITYPLALDKDGHIFESVTIDNAGITRNVLIDKTGKIAFLTRGFNPEDFIALKEEIKRRIN